MLLKVTGHYKGTNEKAILQTPRHRHDRRSVGWILISQETLLEGQAANL